MDTPHCHIFDTIMLRPSWKKWAADASPMLVMIPVALYLLYTEAIPFRVVWILAIVAWCLSLVWSVLVWVNIKYYITSDQLMCESGVITRRKEFIELYRIIDFQEHRTLLEQMLGIKTVIVHSTDRSNPRLPMIGIHARLDIVSCLRERVFSCRAANRITEFSNLPSL